MALVVVGGGRRSGKSRYAMALASAHGPRLAFVATLEPRDDEEREKVDAARAARGRGFETAEAPLDLQDVLGARLAGFDAVVIDDLTVWVSNAVMAGREEAMVEADAERLLQAASAGPAEVVIVTSDVDFGFPADSDDSRRFRRLAGLINRRAAETASRLYWMVFGIPMRVR
jgi:adenosylcobinamide kinase / adenosylcobinamide-phosphate guanylyltransferase